MRRTILGLVLALAAPVASAAPHAATKFERGDLIHFVDLGSIWKTQNSVRVRTTIIRKSAQAMGDLAVGSRVRVARMETEFDCTSKRVRQRSQDLYDTALKLNTAFERPHAWAPVTEDDMGLLSIACGGAPRHTEDADWATVARNWLRILASPDVGDARRTQDKVAAALKESDTSTPPKLGPAPVRPRWTRPANGAVSAGYFEAKYLVEEGVHHLGTDIAAEGGTWVMAPADGEVVINKTSSTDVMQAYMVIREANGHEHVLGHVSSALQIGDDVQRGKPLAKVREWPGNSHVHWGVNRTGVASAIGGGWGWGRAPRSSTLQAASVRGWSDPMVEVGAR